MKRLIPRIQRGITLHNKRDEHLFPRAIRLYVSPCTRRASLIVVTIRHERAEYTWFNYTHLARRPLYASRTTPSSDHDEFPLTYGRYSSRYIPDNNSPTIQNFRNFGAHRPEAFTITREQFDKRDKSNFETRYPAFEFYV